MGLCIPSFDCLPHFIDRLQSLLEAAGFAVRYHRFPEKHKEAIAMEAFIVQRGAAEVTIYIDRNQAAQPDWDKTAIVRKMMAERAAAGLGPPPRPVDPAMVGRLDVFYQRTRLDAFREMLNPEYRNCHARLAMDVEGLLLREGGKELKSYGRPCGDQYAS